MGTGQDSAIARTLSSFMPIGASIRRIAQSLYISCGTVQLALDQLELARATGPIEGPSRLHSAGQSPGGERRRLPLEPEISAGSLAEKGPGSCGFLSNSASLSGSRRSAE